MPVLWANRAALARRAASEFVACAVLPHRLHAAGTDQCYPVLQQSRDVCSVVRCCCRNPAHHRGHPEASGDADRRHHGAAYLGDRH